MTFARPKPPQRNPISRKGQSHLSGLVQDNFSQIFILLLQFLKSNFVLKNVNWGHRARSLQ